MDEFPDDCYADKLTYKLNIKTMRQDITNLLRQKDFPFIYNGREYEPIGRKEDLRIIAKELEERGFVCDINSSTDKYALWYYIEIDLPREFKIT